jgi:hypothetical protein
VKETPQFCERRAWLRWILQGPFDKKAIEAITYVTPVEKDWPAKQKEEG